MTIADANAPFANGMKAIISNEGLKQSHVAKKAGYSPQELSDMLNGRKLIKACDILKLSAAMGVTANDIYEAGKGGE